MVRGTLAVLVGLTALLGILVQDGSSWVTLTTSNTSSTDAPALALFGVLPVIRAGGQRYLYGGLDWEGHERELEDILAETALEMRKVAIEGFARRSEDWGELEALAEGAEQLCLASDTKALHRFVRRMGVTPLSGWRLRH